MLGPTAATQILEFPIQKISAAGGSRLRHPPSGTSPESKASLPQWLRDWSLSGQPANT